MGMIAYRFVGMEDKVVMIPDDILVKINIVKNSHTRSYQIFTGQTFDTWHDTGTNGADAPNQEAWLHQWKPASNISGFNFAADGVVRIVNGKTYRGMIIQLTPLNEVTWAAGTAVGNKTSYHVEQCFGGANVWSNSLYVNAALHGGLMEAKGLKVDKALVQHNYWYGKHCPGQIRNRGIWKDVVEMVRVAHKNAALAKGGQLPVEETPNLDFVKPSAVLNPDGTKWMGDKDITFNNVQFFEDPRTVKTVNSAVNLRVYAASTSAPTGNPIAPNTTFDVVGWVFGEKVGDEDRWWITKSSHSRVWVGGTVEKPEDANKPTEPQKPEENKNFKIVNGQVYYKSSNEIREVVAENDGTIYKYADLDSEKVGSFKAGDKLKVAYWCLGDVQEDEVVWWILDDPQGRDDIAFGGRVHASDTMERPD